MESLAYLELALVCEAPAQELKIFDPPKWQNLSTQTYVRLLSLALMLSVLSAAGSAFAQIDPGNPNLRSVQDRLRDLGYFPRSSTGQLGPVTKQALTNFQRDYQLSLTGKPDRSTVIALNSLDEDDRSFKTTYTNYSYNELRYGDSGADVTALQRRLKELGYFNTHPTGSFREITLNAVRYFQRINRLRVTGVADRQTLALLFASTRPTPPVTPPDISENGGCKGLRFGDRGATVDLIQRQLKALGYFEGGIDGKFRERTLYAVTRFQQDFNLVSDGCADTATLKAIDAQMREAEITLYPGENDDQSNNAGDFLDLGDTGREVELLQRRLQQLGYYRSQIHGWFDRPTQEALIGFQRDSGLSGTGTVDRSTRSALRQANKQAAKPQQPVATGLRRGDTGPGVRQLQSALRSLGKNPGPVNGVFGAETEWAVLSFQRERNLSPATGIATPATLAAIQKGLAGRVTVPAVPISSSVNSRSSIQQLQTRLQGLGFYTGSVTGVLDAPTKDALDRAVRRYGVSREDLLSQTF
ncbi:MAG: hypothetical protein EAZ10_13530 [Oscillatoriales cyanobacterium]|nr:MAG: hypothetical protein EAZ10_13530 [Oscillatoriales cyanobacterium]